MTLRNLTLKVLESQKLHSLNMNVLHDSIQGFYKMQLSNWNSTENIISV